MKKTFITICLLAGLTANAQNQNLGFKYGLKLSNTTTIEHYEEQYGGPFKYKSRLTDWVAPSVSFVIKNKSNNFHELELKGLGINSDNIFNNAPGTNTPDPYTTFSTTSHITIQYQYVQNFFKNKNSRWMPSIAIGLSSDVTWKKYGYYNSTDKYNSRYTDLTFVGFITPGISYSIGKRFFATASLPIALFNSYSSFGKANSNFDPKLYQDYENNIFTTLPAFFSFKLGLGIKL